MRAKEFVVEYKRDITAQKFGDKLISAFGRNETSYSVSHIRYRTGPNSVQVGLNGAYTVVDMASHPQKYHDKTIKMSVLDKVMAISPENAPQALEQIKPKLIETLLTIFEESDPTPNKEFTPWLAQRYASGNTILEDVKSTIKEYLTKFILLKRKKLLQPPANDINRYKDFKEFMDIMDQYELPEEETTDKGQAKTVYDDSNVRIVMPEDEHAACYYGRGSRWCTAATKGDNYFDHYNNQGPLYILIPKNPQYNGEKYQLHFPSGQFMDEQDDPINLVKLITERFPELYKFFIEQKTEMKDWIIFTPDNVLKEILSRMRGGAMGFINKQVGEREIEGTKYYNEYIKTNYQNEKGETDWDAIVKNGDVYDKWRVKVGEILQIEEYRNGAKYSLDKLTPNNIKDFLSFGIRPFDTTLTLLGVASADFIHHEEGNERYVKDISDYLKSIRVIPEKDGRYKLVR